MSVIGGLTIEDYENLPDFLVRNHELVDGRLVDVSGNIGAHNSLRDSLIVLLRPYVRGDGLGCAISENRIRVR